MLPVSILLALNPNPDFAVRLWRALPSVGKGNVVVSPASVEACLGLLIPAVGPSSKPALAKALGAEQGGLPDFQKGLQSRLRSWTEGGETTIANAGFFSSTPRPAYVAAIEKGYGAKAERFRSLAQVNGWVDEKTKGRIPKLFERLDPGTHAVFLNAVTFDGDWATAFNAAATQKAPFNAPSGTRSVDMMNRNLSAAYAEGAGFQLANLPYKGGRYQMTILLPDQGDPSRFLAAGDWRSLAVSSRKLNLALPKFTVRSAPDVEGALKAMGLEPLFTRIDLSPALPNGARDKIDQIAHRTYVKVDEKGTQAAAATGIATTRGISVGNRPIQFRVDRPFAFAIQQVATGEILFEGVIREP